MRTFAFSVLALGLGLVGAQLSACSNSADDCNATATCGNAAGTAAHAGSAGKSGGGSGGGDGGGSETGGKPSGGGSSNTSGNGGSSNMAGAGAGGEGGEGNRACTGEVSDDAACWTTDEYGVFVSSEHGDDATGDGTKAAPFATIMKGVTSAAGKNVYICVGTTKDYGEKVSLDRNTDGAHLYGGFDCETWDYSVARKAKVKSPETVALRIQLLEVGASIENLRFFAADGSGDDASSYGAFVTDSKNVKLKRVEITAGAGLKGADGQPGDKGADGTKVPVADNAPQKGKAAICTAPPATQSGGTWGATLSCGSAGGNGGTGRSDVALAGGSGDPGLPASNVDPAGVDNSGQGSATVGQDGMPGDHGSNGLPGNLGVAATSAGVFIAQGFAPSAGHNGVAGHVGQGGGGGGASKGNGTCVGASGGAGGMGGCGGTPGLAGRGGGASVGLSSWNSELTLIACTVTSAGGGDGGHGGAGGLRGQGAKGADGGLGSGVVGDAGDGGKGGDGGDGGSGSGGSGGPSIAIVFSGNQPSFDLADTHLTPGKGGTAGVGGSVSDVKAPNGTDGAAADIFEVK